MVDVFGLATEEPAVSSKIAEDVIWQALRTGAITALDNLLGQDNQAATKSISCRSAVGEARPLLERGADLATGHSTDRVGRSSWRPNDSRAGWAIHRHVARYSVMARIWLLSHLIMLLLIEDTAGRVPDARPCAARKSASDVLAMAPACRAATRTARRYPLPIRSEDHRNYSLYDAASPA